MIGIGDDRNSFRLGRIPDGWTCEQVGALCTAVLDCSHSTPVWTTDGVVVIRNQNIRDGQLDLSNPSFTDEVHYQERTRRAIPAHGDLVITREAPIGLVCSIPKGLKCCLGQRLVLLRVDSEVADRNYLLFALLADQTQKAMLLAGGAGSTVSNLRIPFLKAIGIPLAPLPEQRAIAAALSDVDALITQLDRLIAKKCDLKRAAMQQLLTGKTRLPGFIGRWEVKRLGDLFVFSGGLSKSRDDLGVEGYCYLHYGDIHVSTKSWVDLDKEYESLPKLEIPLSRVAAKSLLNDGDVVFVDASEDDEGTSRHWVVSNSAGRPFIAGLHTTVAKSRTIELDNGFKRYCFQSRQIKDQFVTFAVGTKVSGVNKSNVKKIELKYPVELSEQSAIAQLLSDMDAEITGLQARRDKTKAVKQGMMQELLTGRIRLA